MHPRLLDYYNRELQHLREMGGEFAADHPKIAARLGLEQFECADPYVERLLEGFAFLTARIQLQHDGQFPQFSQQMLDMLYPHYLAPTPSMAVLQLQPDLTHPRLAAGVTVPRDSVFHSGLGPHGDTRCTYRNAHEVTLWPLALVEAQYLRYSTLASDMPAPRAERPARAFLRLRFQVQGGLAASALALDKLPLYLQGADSMPFQLYEHLLGAQCGASLRWGTRADEHAVLPPLAALGYDEREALLPVPTRALPGFRLLQEYFAFPQRYLFVEQTGLAAALSACRRDQFELLWFFERHEPSFEQMIDRNHFALFATPAINLFPLRAARIELTDTRFEHRIVPDPTRPLDYEVCQVTGVQGYNRDNVKLQRFQPFYHACDLPAAVPTRAYYQLRRETCQPSTRQLREGTRTRYPGSETYIALVDGEQAPYRSDLQHLGLELLCSNRDLPLAMPLSGASDFVAEDALPLKAIRCLSGPCPPRPMLADSHIAWRALNHLTINHLSLAMSEPANGLTSLQNLLALYCPRHDLAGRQRIEGIRAISARTVTRRLSQAGPIAFGRGVELTLTFDDMAFADGGAFLLASVLRHFFSHGASINSFVETVARAPSRGEFMRWRAEAGSCWTI
ncbi:type VI secretion system baseplate subunit TssF [Paludibacterium purpuratum]|uniref:Type VI secretion system protein ImpG n=1 Tax=Paludibacterium purpuratum TaxID=1144873 RepID=A0A4R7B3I4_9NEIS|nr:type VI secretion system baseplate subunit TssF [Paludibacterium purpuratum]TDR78362.1 type VI secretion system protein ImpG [Paludibacterium purpuratum]